MRNFILPLIFSVFFFTSFSLYAEPKYELLYSFPRNRDENRTSLLHASDGHYYGGARIRHDTWDHGTLFRLKSNGEYDVLYAFSGKDGSQVRSPLIQAKDGSLYGVTFKGGEFNRGSVFKFSLDGELVTLHSFNTFDGRFLNSALSEVEDGIFWGVAKSGGEHDFGTIYQVSSRGEFEIIHEFDGADGKEPAAALVLHRNGSVYGVTRRGGDEDEGVIFKIGKDKKLNTIYSFLEEEGHFPSGLTVSDDGLVYGVMTRGGTQNLGSIFKIDDQDQIITSYSFRDDSGSSPGGRLIRNSEGGFYGLSRNSEGSSNSQIYSFHPDGSFKIIKRFNELLREASLFSTNQLLFWKNRQYSSQSTSTYTIPFIVNVEARDDEELSKGQYLFDIRGRYPSSSLIKGNDSNYYGVTSHGGDKIGTNGIDLGFGTIYSFNPNTQSLSTVHRFSEEEGKNPSGDLIEVSPGVFFGVAVRGGANNLGVVFRYDLNSDDLKVIHSFSSRDGRYPRYGLTLADDGLLYGTTPSGRTPALGGTLFSIHPQKERLEESYILELPAITSVSDKLLSASDGFLYGTGGLNNRVGGGAIFRFDLETEEITIVYEFGPLDGKFSRSTLLETSDGIFYGSTNRGGEFDRGTIFRLTNNGSFKKIHSFSGGGGFPAFTLAQGRSGALFGIGGFSFGSHTLYQIDVRGNYQKLHESESSIEGRSPVGFLNQLQDGSFLGANKYGGSNGDGVIFRLSGVDELLSFQRGDTNTNGVLEVADGLLTIEYLFLNGEPLNCWDAVDANDDGTISITDTIFLFQSLFFGGELNQEFCIQDQTQDLLTCYEVNMICKE